MSLREARRRESVPVPNTSLGENGLTAEEEYKIMLLWWVIIIDHHLSLTRERQKRWHRGLGTGVIDRYRRSPTRLA